MCLAAGFFGVQERTRAAFLSETQIPEALKDLGVLRLYRTGDLGRLSDGSLHFIGRKDHCQA